MSSKPNDGPRLIVGFSGHRPNRLKISEGLLRREISAPLRALEAGAREAAADASLWALSALAEGADSVFAEAALETRYALRAILPFAPGDYFQTFDDPGHAARFEALLGRAGSKEILPGSLSATKDAYAAVGAKIVSEADLLIAVWDGGPPAGRGGTPDVLAMAVKQGRPCLWIDATGETALRALDANADTLEQAAAEAKPIAAPQLHALAVSIADPTDE